MVGRKPFEKSNSEKKFERRKRNKINIRHNSPVAGKSKGARRWMKIRRRIRKRLLGG